MCDGGFSQSKFQPVVLPVQGRWSSHPGVGGSTAEVAVQGNLCFPALLHSREFEMQSRTLPGQ